MHKEYRRDVGRFVEIAPGGEVIWIQGPNKLLFPQYTFQQTLSEKRPAIAIDRKHKGNDDPEDPDNAPTTVINFKKLAREADKQLESTLWFPTAPDPEVTQRRPISFEEAVQRLRRRKVPRELRASPKQLIKQIRHHDAMKDHIKHPYGFVDPGRLYRDRKRPWSCPPAFKDPSKRLQFMQWKSGYAKIICYHTTDGGKKSYLL
jgi:hypothetical protein